MSESFDNLIVTDTPPLPALPHTRRQERRWIFILLLLGLGATLALTTLAGNAATFALLFNANLFFVAFVAAFEMARYVVMTFSTRLIVRIVDARVPFPLLFKVVMAAQAANRTFVGGAAGFVIRLAFFLKRGMHSGTFVAVESVEDAVSLVAISLLFVAGIAIVLASGAAELRGEVVGSVVVGALVLAALVIFVLRRRAWVEGIADGIALTANRLLGKLVRRNLYDAARVRGGVDDFYRALGLARHDPLRISLAFLCALARLGCDAIALYFSFRAVGYEPAPGLVLLIFVVASSVATLSAVPGQIGVMETTLALMSTALGIPAPVAVSATLLYRLISFWLPIPFGYVFAWDLERKGAL